LTRPDANQEIADHDQNSWQTVHPGLLQTFEEASFAIYRTKFTPFASTSRNGGQILFESLSGIAEIWLDHQLIARKEFPEPAPFAAHIPPAEGIRTLSVLVKSVGVTETGLGATVRVQESEHPAV
jgi:beta-galactosidase